MWYELKKLLFGSLIIGLCMLLVWGVILFITYVPHGNFIMIGLAILCGASGLGGFILGPKQDKDK